MDASLDTDIVIHLYKSNKIDLLLSFCDELYMHEYLLNNELKRKSYTVHEQFMKDVKNGNINIISNSDLRVMGIAAFLSDDTKDYGPHDSLVRGMIEGINYVYRYRILIWNRLNVLCL